MNIKRFDYNQLKKSNRIILPIVVFMMSIITYSCFKDDFELDRIASGQYSPNIAAPLIHSEMTLSDIIRDYDDEHIFQEDGTNFITLIYKGTVFSQLASEIFIIPNQNFTKTENFNMSPATPIGDSVITTYSQVFTFAAQSGAKYDSVNLKSGDLNMQISLDLNQDAKFRFSIPNATKNGVPFYKEVPYNYNGVIPSVLNTTFDLSDYTIVFNNSGSDNQIDVDIEVVAYNSGNAILPAYSFNFTQDFLNLKYKRLFGYLGQQNFNLAADTVAIDIFKNTISGHFILEDPKIKILASNSFGMPIDIIFNNITAMSPVIAPYIVPVSGPGLPNPFSINAPTILQLGLFAKDSVTLDKNNSNFDDALNLSPRTVAYSINGLSNPSATPVQNFVLENSKFNVDLEVILPLYGRAWNFILQDTFDFGFENIDEIDWVSFKINASNSFPIESQIQILFTDSNYVILDSLLNPLQSVVAAGICGPAPDYRVSSPTNKLTESTITREKINKLIPCKKMIIRGRLATANNGNDIVKIYSDYKLDVKLGARVQLKANYTIN